MGVARQASAAATRGFVLQRNADGEDEGQDELDKRLAIVKQLQGGGFVLEVDGDGAVLAGRFDRLSHVSPSVEMAIGADETSCR